MKALNHIVLITTSLTPTLILADIEACLQANNQLHNDATHICSEALQTPGISADDQSIIYVTQASYYIKKDQFNEAEKVLELGFNVNPKMLENGPFRYNWLRTKGVLYFSKEEFISALPFFEQAIDVAQIMQSNKIIATSYNDLGATYLELDNYTEALVWVRNSLAIRESENNLELSGTASANIAEIYVVSGENNKALEYFNSAIKLLKKAASKDTVKAQRLDISLAKIYLSVANLHMDESRFDKALHNLQAAINVYQTHKLKGEQVKVLSTIGRMYLDQANPDKAMSYLWQAQAIEESLESQNNLDFKLIMVDALVQNDQLKEAEELATEGLSHAISKSNKLSEVGFLTSLASIYEQNGSLKQSIGFLKKSEMINQEILESKYDRTRAKLMVELESHRKQREIDSLQELKTISDMKIKQQRQIFYLVALLLLMLIVFLLFKLLYRRKIDQLIRRDQSSHTNELIKLTVSKNDIKSLFKGMDSQLVCFDLAGLIQFSSDSSNIDTKMSDKYPEIWRQTLESLNEEDQLTKDLYLDQNKTGAVDDAMIHQMNYLDNYLVCLFLPSGTKKTNALAYAENIRKYSEFKQQLSTLNDFAQELPINNITAVKPILLATKALKINNSHSNPTTTTSREFKEALVEIMVMCLEIWQLNSNNTAIDLAEQSGLWLVSIENGQLRTRTMNRYIHIDKFPENPRWLQVVKTAHYVLSHCDLNINQRQQLNDKIDWVKSHRKNRSLGH